MEWFQQHDAVALLGLAVLLGLTEMLSGDLILLMLAVGVLAGAGTALFTTGVMAPALVAAVVALCMLFLARPPILRRLHGDNDLVTGFDAIVGQHGVVTGLPDHSTSHELGQAKIAGEIWSIQPVNGEDILDTGTRVEVVEIRGATAVVKPMPMLDMYASDGSDQ